MYKIKDGDIKFIELRHLFTKVDLHHGRNTKAQTRDDLIVPPTRTLFGERSIVVFGSRIRNLLAPDMRTLGTFDTFCRHYWKA